VSDRVNIADVLEVSADLLGERPRPDGVPLDLHLIRLGGRLAQAIGEPRAFRAGDVVHVRGSPHNAVVFDRRDLPPITPDWMELQAHDRKDLVFIGAFTCERGFAYQLVPAYTLEHVE
jgi:hypothetical protein